MNDNISDLKETEKNIEANDNNKVFAIVLILVGVAVMVGNLTNFSFENWWALFMLIPAGAIWMNVWHDYQENGRLSRKSSGSIIPGVVILAMMAIFLFNLSWAVFWPVSIIAVGLSILVGSR
jgi:hypothetical protein